jgi:hypothetical protein
VLSLLITVLAHRQISPFVCFWKFGIYCVVCIKNSSCTPSNKSICVFWEVWNLMCCLYQEQFLHTVKQVHLCVLLEVWNILCCLYQEQFLHTVKEVHLCVVLEILEFTVLSLLITVLAHRQTSPFVCF